MPPPDRQLNTTLVSLMERLAGGSDTGVTLGMDDIPGADLTLLQFLTTSGLMRPDRPASAAICDGCERSCSMPVIFRRPAGCRPAQCFVQCDKRDDIGQVEVDPERLRHWRLSIEAMASLLAKHLQTNRKPRREAGRCCWSLGEIARGTGSIPVTLAATASEMPHRSGLGIVFGGSRAPSNGSVLAVDQLLEFRGGQLGVRTESLELALADRFDDERIALEIRYERGDVLLLNHITAQRRVLASPNFDSMNDNVFQHLYEHPGQTFTVGELGAAARTSGLKDLHKVAEVLHFEGDLKKLFFRVSKDKIVFDRSVSVGRLATLGIDPKSII